MSSGSSHITVLIVDDHPLIREGIRAVLASEPDIHVVSEATNGEEGVREFLAHRPAVTLMDLQMPAMDGVAAISAICKQWPAARIVVLTTYKGDVQALRALKAGASGYLLKNMIRKDMIAAIRAVHAGGRYVAPEIAIEMGVHASDETLSPREVGVLTEMLAGGSNKQIADRLAVSEETIKSHMKNILGKLQAADRSHALLIAIRRGIVQGPSE